jgi:DNA-binding transcriptional LysR family regulator
LLEEGIDLSIRVGPLADSSLVAHSVGSVRRVTVASPAFLRAHGTPASPGDLAHANCVRMRDQTARAFRFVEHGRTFDVAVTGNLEFNQIKPAILACEAGFGFGSFTSFQIAPALAAGRLRIVLSEFEEAPRPINITYPHARLLPARIRALVDMLRGELKRRLAEGRGARRSD